MKPVRVLIVDDNATVRALLRAYLEHDAGIRVAGEAVNGRDAVRMVSELKPDLVTMDLEMPVLDGLDAIAEIMVSHPVPILVVSGVADAHKAYAAVARGALDVIDKPECDPAARAAFVAQVRMLAGVPVIRHIRAHHPPLPVRAPARPMNAVRRGAPRMCAIAASTGGPTALGIILGTLGANFPCPILVSQHIADGFAPGLAKWLGSVCKMPVRLAREGETPQPGTIYISPSEQNLMLTRDRRLHLAPRRPHEIYHPTCDILLSSVAEAYGAAAIGVILTGMGADGASGLGKLHQAGAATLAQDEASSVVYGMNRVAIERGYAGEVLPADEIGPALQRLLGQSG